MSDNLFITEGSVYQNGSRQEVSQSLPFILDNLHSQLDGTPLERFEAGAEYVDASTGSRWRLKPSSRPAHIRAGIIFNQTTKLAHFDSLSGGGGGGNTDLSVGTITSSTLQVASSTGTSATIPSATATEAGLLTASDKIKLNNLRLQKLDFSVNLLTGSIPVGEVASTRDTFSMPFEIFNATLRVSNGMSNISSSTIFEIKQGTTVYVSFTVPANTPNNTYIQGNIVTPTVVASSTNFTTLSLHTPITLQAVTNLDIILNTRIN